MKIKILFEGILNESRYEKTVFLHMRKQRRVKDADQLRDDCEMYRNVQKKWEEKNPS